MIRNKVYKCIKDTEAYQRTCHTENIVIPEGNTVKYHYTTRDHIIVAYPNYAGYEVKTNITINDWENFEAV